LSALRLAWWYCTMQTFHDMTVPNASSSENSDMHCPRSAVQPITSPSKVNINVCPNRRAVLLKPGCTNFDVRYAVSNKPSLEPQYIEEGKIDSQMNENNWQNQQCLKILLQLVTVKKITPASAEEEIKRGFPRISSYLNQRALKLQSAKKTCPVVLEEREGIKQSTSIVHKNISPKSLKKDADTHGNNGDSFPRFQIAHVNDISNGESTEAVLDPRHK